MPVLLVPTVNGVFPEAVLLTKAVSVPVVEVLALLAVVLITGVAVT